MKVSAILLMDKAGLFLWKTLFRLWKRVLVNL